MPQRRSSLIIVRVRLQKKLGLNALELIMFEDYYYHGTRAVLLTELLLDFSSTGRQPQIPAFGSYTNFNLNNLNGNSRFMELSDLENRFIKFVASNRRPSDLHYVVISQVESCPYLFLSGCSRSRNKESFSRIFNRIQKIGYERAYAGCEGLRGQWTRKEIFKTWTISNFFIFILGRLRRTHQVILLPYRRFCK